MRRASWHIRGTQRTSRLETRLDRDAGKQSRIEHGNNGRNCMPWIVNARCSRGTLLLNTPGRCCDHADRLTNVNVNRSGLVKRCTSKFIIILNRALRPRLLTILWMRLCHSWFMIREAEQHTKPDFRVCCFDLVVFTIHHAFSIKSPLKLAFY